jgi:hypothetical protein
MIKTILVLGAVVAAATAVTFGFMTFREGPRPAHAKARRS